MTKLLRALSLMAAMAVLAGGSTVAQDKKAEKKDDKKAEKKDDKKADKKEAAGTVEIYKGKNGFRYRVKSAEGKTIAMPLPQMSWETKEETIEAINELKEALKAKPVEIKEDK